MIPIAHKRRTGGSRDVDGRSSAAVAIGFGFLPSEIPAPILDFLLSAAPANVDVHENLFRAVTARACCDAMRHVTPTGANKSRGPAIVAHIIAEAREWFRDDPGADFQLVCALANLDAQKLKALMVAAIRLDERDHGVVTVPSANARGKPARLSEPAMPGTGLGVAARPFVVEKIIRRRGEQRRAAP